MNSEKTFERGIALDEIRWEDHENTVFYQPYIVFDDVYINAYHGSELLNHRDYGQKLYTFHDDEPLFETLDEAEAELEIKIEDIYNNLKSSLWMVKWADRLNRQPQKVQNPNQLKLV